MAGSTIHIVYINVATSCLDGDTIVTCMEQEKYATVSVLYTTGRTAHPLECLNLGVKHKYVAEAIAWIVPCQKPMQLAAVEDWCIFRTCESIQ